MPKAASRIAGVLTKHEGDLLDEWFAQMQAGGFNADSRTNQTELQGQAREFLRLLQKAASAGGEITDTKRPEWREIGEYLTTVSRDRVLKGYSSDETATFIFSFKKPLFDRLRKEVGKDADALAEEIWLATELLDKMGLLTVRAYQKTREEVISRQQEELLELSTPVVKLWDGVLALPMIGTLDSARTQIVMESLLQAIVESGSEIAIIDITGVPTVDTLVAQHLLKTITAIRLMGADAIISGVRPQIAQTIVHLGVDLQGVTTKATLADALALALKRSGFVLTRTQPTSGAN